MTARSEQKKRSYRSIVASAARLLRAKGIAGANVAEVMKGAGMTVGGFYAHFESKEAMVDAALQRAAEEMCEALFAGLEARPMADRVGLVLERYLSAAHRDHQTHGCALPAVVGEIATTAPEHGVTLRAQIDGMAQLICTHLPDPGPLPGRHLALGLVALMYGGLSLSQALKGSPLSDEVLKACRALGVHAAKRAAPRSA